MQASWSATTATCLLLTVGAWKAGQPARAAPRSETPPAAAVTREVRRILANVKHTKYSRPTRVDEAAGSYELDCSGLVCYVLKRAVPEQYRRVAIPKGQSRPTARNFHDHFAGAPTTACGKDGWRRIERMLDVRPGDILAWRAATPKPGSTGHVVIIDGRPTPTRDGQI